jgi:hypothetical protein
MPDHRKDNASRTDTPLRFDFARLGTLITPCGNTIERAQYLVVK